LNLRFFFRRTALFRRFSRSELPFLGVNGSGVYLSNG